MSDYFCWQQYYDRDTARQTKSDEIRYYQGHQHGVRPTAEQWGTCLNDLANKVNIIRETHQPPLAALPIGTISAGAEKKTRSAH